MRNSQDPVAFVNYVSVEAQLAVRLRVLFDKAAWLCLFWELWRSEEGVSLTLI
jgi:hypothetical protein